jgi:hypothetical protein
MIKMDLPQMFTQSRAKRQCFTKHVGLPHVDLKKGASGIRVIRLGIPLIDDMSDLIDGIYIRPSISFYKHIERR